MRAVIHKVVAPDIIPVRRAQTHTRPIGQPQPAEFRLSLRNLQALSSPQVVATRTGWRMNDQCSQISVRKTAVNAAENGRSIWRAGCVAACRGVPQLNCCTLFSLSKFWLSWMQVWAKVRGSGVRLEDGAVKVERHEVHVRADGEKKPASTVAEKETEKAAVQPG